MPGRVGMLSLHPSSLEFSRLPIPEAESDSGYEIKGFSLFCSDSATLSPPSGKGTQENNLARQSV